jgi:hypothetical protein
MRQKIAALFAAVAALIGGGYSSAALHERADAERARGAPGISFAPGTDDQRPARR